MADDRSKSNDVYVEQGELTRMRDPRTGQLKDVDMSLAALSRTMEQIRKGAEIINQPSTSFDMAMSRFDYISELVLDHAQFSPKLQNLQIRVLDKTVEVVKNYEEFEQLRMNFARNYYMELAKTELSKSHKIGRKNALERALDLLDKGSRYYLTKDEEFQNYIKLLQEEFNQHSK